VLYAVYPNRGYFKLSPTGTVTVEDDGFTSFKASKGKHRYLIADKEHIIRVTEALVQLSSQPPR
jgi:purine nucleosidase